MLSLSLCQNTGEEIGSLWFAFFIFLLFRVGVRRFTGVASATNLLGSALILCESGQGLQCSTGALLALAVNGDQISVVWKLLLELAVQYPLHSIACELGKILDC